MSLKGKESKIILGVEMGAFEKKLKARGVKFFIFASPDVPKKDQPKWHNLLINGLTEYFDNVSIYYDSSFIAEPKLLPLPKKKMMAIKVFCPDPKFKLKPSEANAFYNKLCKRYINFVTKSLSKTKFEFEGYRFDILFRMHPPEDLNGIIPMP